MTPDERKAVAVALAERFGTTEEDARVIRAAVGVVVDRLVFGLYPPTGGGSDE